MKYARDEELKEPSGDLYKCVCSTGIVKSIVSVVFD